MVDEVVEDDDEDETAADVEVVEDAEPTSDGDVVDDGEDTLCLSRFRFRDGGTITGRVRDAAVVTGGDRVYEADALTILLMELSEFSDSLGFIVNVAVISVLTSSDLGVGDGILSLSIVDGGIGVVVVVVVDDVDGVFCDSVSFCI